MKKEFYSPEIKEKSEDKKKKEKNTPPKIGRRAFMKQALSGLGVLAVGPSLKAMESILDQPKTDKKAKELLKERSVDSKKQESIFEEQDPEKIISKLNYIVEKIGGRTASQLDCSWESIYDLNNRPEARKRLIKNLDQKPEVEEEAKEPVVEKSLKEIDLTPRIVKKIFKTLPQSWLREIALVTYRDEKKEAIINEETGEKAELVAHHQSKGGEDLSEIYFFQGAKMKEIKELLFNTLVYECAHVNNWRNRADLTLAQRISLFHEVIKQVESPDRFRDPYVESIKHRDKKEEIVKRTTEYWATLCKWTLGEPENDKFPASHKKLIFDYFKLTDPEFNIAQNTKLRKRIINNYLRIEPLDISPDTGGP